MNYSNSNIRAKLISIFELLPIIMFALSILIARAHNAYWPMSQFYWTPETDSTQISDVFTYYKSIVIMGSAVAAILVLIIKYFSSDFHFKKNPVIIPILIYSAFVILSFVFSDYKYFALHGYTNQSQGTFVLLSYMVMLIYIINVVDNIKQIKIVIAMMLIAALLLGILGLTQATGHDFFRSVIGQKMMTPNKMTVFGMRAWEVIDEYAKDGRTVYDYTFNNGEVYQTVFNINYVPFYLNLIIPLVLMLFLYNWNNIGKIRVPILAGIIGLYALILFNYISAQSMSGYLGLVVGIIIGSVLLRDYLSRHIKQVCVIALVTILIFGATTNRWLNEIKHNVSIVTNTIMALTAEDIYAESLVSQFDINRAGMYMPHIDYIETGEDCVDFSINGNVLKINRNEENGSYYLSDADGTQVALTNQNMEKGLFRILDDRYYEYIKLSIMLDNEVEYLSVISTFDYSDPPYVEWIFKYTDDGFKFIAPTGKETELHQIKSVQLFKDDSWGSGRALIWERCIPLLKSRFIIGSGADTFTLVYPQSNYVDTFNAGIAQVIITDKPHNIYLQTWINTGLVSLLAWLSIVLLSVISAYKRIRSYDYSVSWFIAVGLFVGITGYSITAIFNDGSVCTLPYLYVMLGLSIVIPRLCDNAPNDNSSNE